MKAIFVMVKCELGQAYEVADRAIEDLRKHPGNEVYDLRKLGG